MTLKKKGLVALIIVFATFRMRSASFSTVFIYFKIAHIIVFPLTLDVKKGGASTQAQTGVNMH